MSDDKDESWRGKAGRLSNNEMIEFLNEGQLGRLAVLEEDGWPYVIPVWYEYSDGGYYIIPRAKSRWPLFVRPVRTTTWQGVDWAPKYKHSKW